MASAFSIESIERADGGGDELWRDGGVSRSRIDAGVPEQHLDDADIGSVFEEVSGETVAESVDGDVFGDAGAEDGFAAGDGEGGGAEMAILFPGGEEEILGLPGSGEGGADVAAEDVEEARGEHGVAVFVTFALLDAEEHAAGIDVGDFEGEGFGDAESGSVAEHEGGAVLEGGDVIEEGEDLFVAEDYGEFVGSAGAREVLFGPGHFEGSEVEELDGTEILVDGFDGEFAFVEEVELVLADGFEVELVGALLEVSGEGGDVRDIVFLSACGEVAQLHVFDHSLTERRHVGLLES
jgi:hypothetical protein